jgi:hypothetical protein
MNVIRKGMRSREETFKALPVTNTLIYAHNGGVLPDAVPTVIGLLEKALNKHSVDPIKKRKIQSLSIEVLQNQVRHGIHSDGTTTRVNNSTFSVKKSGNTCTITAGNLVEPSAIAELTKTLRSINSATKEEIVQRYRNQILNAHNSSSGAGLGLLDMRRKSGSMITFTFSEKSTCHTYFQIKLTL